MAMHTIYFVDDDQLVIDKYWMRRKLCMENGFEIIGAETDPHKALEEIVAMSPDAVISDLKMPGLSGLELFEHLQCHTMRPLFVIASAYSEHKDVRKLFMQSGFDYIIKPVDDQDLIDLLSRLAARISPEPIATQVPTKSQALNAVVSYIKEYPHMNHSTESIGERFSMSPSGLCNLFSRHLNTTFSNYMNTIRLERAERMLLTTMKPVGEISALCGYNDAVYFTRMFKKTYGMSPSRFRDERCFGAAQNAEDGRGEE